MDKIFEELQKLGCTVEMCGSKVTCNPAPVATDTDYLVQIIPDEKAWRTGESVSNQKIASIVDYLSTGNFQLEGSGSYQLAAQTGFMSWRFGDVNLLVSANGAWCTRHRAATALCTRLNLLNKADRIAVFQAVLYANTYVEPASSACHGG